MFGLGKKDSADVPAEPKVTDPKPTGKGRPTPTRKQAEQARRDALKGPSDPKARKKMERQRAQQERLQARQALTTGDEKHLPPRDAGPVRKFIRDHVDGRRTLAEFFVPLAVVVLVLGLIPRASLQQVVSYVWFLMLILLVVDMSVLLVGLSKKLKQQWPDPEDRKGASFYAGMRALQIRRLRLPPPTVKAGGAPVIPKRPKG